MNHFLTTHNVVERSLTNILDTSLSMSWMFTPIKVDFSWRWGEWQNFKHALVEAEWALWSPLNRLNYLCNFCSLLVWEYSGQILKSSNQLCLCLVIFSPSTNESGWRFQDGTARFHTWNLSSPVASQVFWRWPHLKVSQTVARGPLGWGFFWSFSVYLLCSLFLKKSSHGGLVRY